jgi:ubiquitin-like protein ATG12
MAEAVEVSAARAGANSGSLAARPSIKIHLRPVGSAPALKKSKFKVSADETVGALAVFLGNALGGSGTGGGSGESSAPAVPFLYIVGGTPLCPDEVLGELHRCFAAGDELIIQYSQTPAYATG